MVGQISPFGCIMKCNRWELGPFGTIATLLDLGKNTVLETFELTITSFADISLVHGWIYRTLQTITSPTFNKLVFWVLDTRSPWTRMDHDGWNAVDVLLGVLAERNPEFRAAFIVARPGGWIVVPGFLPLARSKGLIEFSSPRVENRFRNLGVL